ncbi:MAG TPA: outer membrane protein assembly factor BamD [Gemmatimonadota bacterium]
MRPARRVALALLVAALGAAACASAPRTSILSADEEYEQGIDAYNRGKWSSAAEHLNRLVLNYSEDPRAAQARYLLGQANFHNEEYPSAAQDFERFQQDFPTDSLSDDAFYWAGRSYEAQALKPELDQSDTQRAISQYGELRRQYPASPFADEARDRIRALRDRLAAKEFMNARYYFKQKLWKATEIYVRSLIEQFPESSYVAPAYLMLVRAYEGQGRLDDAQRIRNTLLEQFPESPEARQVGGPGREPDQPSSAAAAASAPGGSTGEAP